MIFTLTAIAIQAAQPNLVTLEDICIGGASGFTDERVVILCPAEAGAEPSNAFWADVALETDFPNDTMARAYCAWRADLCPIVRRAMRRHVSDRELVRIERAAYPNLRRTRP